VHLTQTTAAETSSGGGHHCCHPATTTISRSIFNIKKIPRLNLMPRTGGLPLLDPGESLSAAAFKDPGENLPAALFLDPGKSLSAGSSCGESLSVGATSSVERTKNLSADPGALLLYIYSAGNELKKRTDDF
jgi:hypothetical protein